MLFPKYRVNYNYNATTANATFIAKLQCINGRTSKVIMILGCATVMLLATTHSCLLWDITYSYSSD